MVSSSQRVITGGAIAVATAALIGFAPNYILAAVTAVFALVLASEWSALTEGRDISRQAPQIALVAVLMLAVYVMPRWMPWLLTIAAVWWVLAFALVLNYGDTRQPVLWQIRLMFRIGMPPAIAVTWAALVFLHQTNFWWLLYCIVLVSLSDIGAYYTGRRFGKTPLFEKLSPGKTRAGLWGGMIVSLVFCLSVTLTVLPTWLDVIHLVLLSTCVIQAGVVGDLFVSLMKRYAGVKDTGTLLPGHGGFLDRTDSLLPSLPLFYFVMFG